MQILSRLQQHFIPLQTFGTFDDDKDNKKDGIPEKTLVKVAIIAAAFFAVTVILVLKAGISAVVVSALILGAAILLFKSMREKRKSDSDVDNNNPFKNYHQILCSTNVPVGQGQSNQPSRGRGVPSNQHVVVGGGHAIPPGRGRGVPPNQHVVVGGGHAIPPSGGGVPPNQHVQVGRGHANLPNSGRGTINK